MKKKNNNQTQKNPVLRGIFLCLPYLFVFFFIYFALSAAFGIAQNTIPFLRYIVDSKPIDEPEATYADDFELALPTPDEVWEPDVYIYPDDIKYGTVWAYLTVDGWWNSDIPVYSCDEDEYLEKGAGRWQGARYPGQNGKTVISGHVITLFYDLEVTSVGAKVTLKTSYGLYEYEVAEVVHFTTSDIEYVVNSDGEDTLFLYTCYPRSNGIRLTDQRCGLICKKIYGEALQ